MRSRYARSISTVCLLSFGLVLRVSAQDLLPSRRAGPGAEIATFEGQRIVNIVFDPVDQPLEASQLNAILPVKRGENYTADNTRAAIERLYATGRYQDIQVDVSPSPGGLVVRFITKNSWFIGNVSASIDLAEPPNAGQIVNASHMDLGDPFNKDQVPVAVENIRKVLVQNGYFDPLIEPQLEYDDTYQQVNITFAITTRKRARYDDPEISGDTSVLSEKNITKATGWHRFLLPGYEGITASRTRGGIDKIRLKYENANRLMATVTLLGMEEEGKKGTPQIDVAPGPQVTITAPGSGISKKALRANVPVFEEHTVDADLLAEGNTNLRDYFQAKGYFDVEVRYRERNVSEGATSIIYEIELGKRHRFVYLDISGNKYFDQKTIRERMFLAPKSFELRNGRYSEAYVRRDIQTIKDLYESNGFRDVVVTARSEDNYNGHSGDMAEFFTIDEGAQYRVSSLVIKGNEKLDLKKPLLSLSSQEGQVFSDFNIATDRQTIIQEYGRNGFPDATLEWNSKPGPRPHTVDVEFVISEGKQQFVRQVVVSGLRTTLPALVNKQLDLNPGEPLSPIAMTDTQRKLYDLGIFSQVNMAIQNPDGDENRKYVLYDLDEARRYSLSVGAGFNGFARIGQKRLGHGSFRSRRRSRRDSAVFLRPESRESFRPRANGDAVSSALHPAKARCPQLHGSEDFQPAEA